MPIFDNSPAAEFNTPSISLRLPPFAGVLKPATSPIVAISLGGAVVIIGIVSYMCFCRAATTTANKHEFGSGISSLHRKSVY